MAKKSKVKKSVAIIGEGETEWFYIDSLRTACRYPFTVAPSFPQHADIGHYKKLIDKCLQDQFDYVICLMDMDRLKHVPAEMAAYQKVKASYGKKVMFVETNPCTEFWFLLHFLPNFSAKHYEWCDDVIPDLQRYMPGYEKTKRYFRKVNLYRYLTENGDLSRAMSYSTRLCQLAQESPDDARSYSEIHKVIELLNTLK